VIEMENEANDKPDVDSNDTPTEAVAAESAAPVSAVPETSEPAAESVVAGLTIGSAAPETVLRMPTTIRGRIDKFGTAMGTGRRKTAVARVRLRKGSGTITVNDRPFEEYFPVERQRLMIQQPLTATGMLGKVDIAVRASGGGVNGQAGAMILGIARAIQALEPEQHGPLSDGGFLTRDDRMVERKKYGHKKARRSFQFSKR
jgi:small subunit ribosomal protein S9